MIGNYTPCLNFVWAAGRDSPSDAIHATSGDPGGLTLGGITQATWEHAVVTRIVSGGLLENATLAQLSAILRANYWGPECDNLPAGLDLLMFNGRMMTGRFPALFQQALGFMGPGAVDGWIGPVSLAKAKSREPETFIDSLSGAHAAYLATLDTWAEFGKGWTTRLKAAQCAAIAMVNAGPVA